MNDTAAWQSTIVCVGGPFQPNMLDWREYFEEIPDENSIQVPVLTNLHFHGGAWGLLISPDQIVLSHQADSFLPQDLIEKGRSIFKKLEESFRYAPIRGVGMNGVHNLGRKERGERDGNAICKAFVSDLFYRAIGKNRNDVFYVLPRAIFRQAEVQFDVNIQPHFDTNGENLHVVLNCHQDVRTQAELQATLDRADVCRKYQSQLMAGIKLERPVH